MTTPAARPSGLKPPSKVAKPQTSIPRPSSLQPAVKVEDTIVKSAKKAGLSSSEAASHASKNVKVVPSSGSSTTSNGNGAKENFKIGDRVVVSGTKHGRIQFLDDTQFAAGEWAGVVLDEAIGKNDGSVNGVRYFQCEPKKGVFARPDKLVLESSTTNGARRSSLSGMGRPSAPRMGTRVGSPRGGTPKDKTPAGTSSLAQEDGDNTGLKGGDRVLVSGSKLGILRFVGPTEFAKGEWAGVELDDENGKNDGAVAGTRYFQCRPKYGLFAPVHKVAKVHNQGANLTDTPRSRRSNSNSSTSSIGSRNYGLNASSGSIMTSKTSELRKAAPPKKSTIAKPITRRKGKRSSEGKMSRSSSQSSLLSEADSVDLNENLKGSQEEQSKSERSPTDFYSLPRRRKGEGRLSRASSRSSILSDTDSTSGLDEQVEHEVALLKLQHEKYVRDTEENLETVKNLLQTADRDKGQILQQLEEERRKAEDYQFRLEEATINSSDMKAEYEGGSEKMKELEASLRVESDKSAKFRQDINDLKNQIENKDFKIAEVETEMSTFTEQIESLKGELEEAKTHSSRLETRSKDNDETTQQLELKVNRIRELEASIAELQSTKTDQRSQIDNLELTLKEGKSSREQIDALVQDLKTKLSEKESSLDSHTTLLAETKTSSQEIERRLQSSEGKCQQLLEDKRKLEGDIQELINNSGNSSEQLGSMNEDLRAKDRRIEELQQELSEANQRVAKLSDELGQTREETEDRLNKLTVKQEEERADHQKQTENLQAQLEQSQSHHATVQESSKSALAELRDQLNARIEDLTKEVDTKDAVLEKERRDKSALEKRVGVAEREMKQAQDEKASLETSFQKASRERDRFLEERDHAVADRQRVTTEKTELILKQEEVHLKHQTLMDQIEKDALARSEATKTTEDLKATIQKVTQERDAAMKERTEAMAASQENGMKLARKEEEIGTLTTDVQKYKEEAERLAELTKDGDGEEIEKQLSEANQELESSKMLLSGMEQDKLDLESQLQRIQAQNTEQREQFENKMEEMTSTLDSMRSHTAHLEGKSHELMEELGSSRATAGVKEFQLNELKSEMEDLRQQMENERNLKLQEGGKVTGLEAILANTKQELEEKVKIVADLDASQQSLTTELHATQQAKIATEEELNSLKKQVDSYREQLTAAEQKGEDNKGAVQAQLMDTKQALDLSQTKVTRLEETEQTLMAQLSSTKDQNKEMQTEMESLQKQLDSSRLEKQQTQKASEKSSTDVSELKTLLSDTKQALDLSQTKVRGLEETEQNLQSQLSSTKDQSKEMETQLESLQKQLDDSRLEKGEMQKTSERSGADVSELRTQLSALKSDLDSERSKVSSLEKDKSEMEESVTSLRQKEASGSEVLKENAELTQELEGLRKKLEEEVSGFEEKRASLQQKVDVSNGVVAEQEKQVQQYKEEVKSLRECITSDASAADSHKERVTALEGERIVLQEKVTLLEASVQDSKRLSNPVSSDLDEDGDPALARLQEEREMAEGQVSFLNSVIVDLQRKNDELRARLDTMENGYAVNGGMDHDLSDLDFEPSGQGPPPRLFCDICDVFDLHDTEDCPLQASSDSPPPTQHHGQRGEDRPYCDTCEMFGHSTETCDDEQTY